MLLKFALLMLLPHDAMHKCSLCRSTVSICLSVCLSVTFMYSVETSKHIFKIFSPLGSHTILVFSYQTLWRYFEGIECRWTREKLWFSTNIWLRRMLSMVRPPSVIHTAVPVHGKMMTVITGEWHHLLFMGDLRRIVYDKNHQPYGKDIRKEFSYMQW